MNVFLKTLITILPLSLCAACLRSPEMGPPRQADFASKLQPLSGDFDGDKIADFAFWNPETGRWYLMTSDRMPSFRRTVRVGSGYQVWWGAPGDEPVVGDYDGDSVTDLAVWRASTATLYILTSTRSYPRPAVRHYDGFAIKVEPPLQPPS